MKAIVYEEYGGPEVLREVEVAVPKPSAHEVLIQVRAASVNGSDWEGLCGKPLYARIGGLFKPKHQILGSDMSGVVVDVGARANQFQIGDEVLGNAMFKRGGFAEFACISENDLIIKPKGITFTDAATLTQAASVALQAVRDKGQVTAGKRILINGAGGTVGTFAIQFAKALNSDITAVDTASKLPFLQELGANHVIDYAQQDFTRLDKKYDFILDVVGNRSISDLKNALAPNGTYTVAGGRILPTLFLGTCATIFSQKSMSVFIWKSNVDDLVHLCKLCEDGALTPIISKSYSLSETPDALRAIGEKSSKGIGVIAIN